MKKKVKINQRKKAKPIENCELTKMPTCPPTGVFAHLHAENHKRLFAYLRGA